MDNYEINFFQNLNRSQKNRFIRSINSTKITLWIDELFMILFPEKPLAIETIARLWNQNKTNFETIISEIITNKDNNELKITTDALYNQVSNLYDAMQSDATAIFETDPAADGIEEIINSYPGFTAIAVYRIANAIAKLNVPLIPRVLSEYAHSKTGIDIHPNATIDVPFIIDHGTGIVIGETAIIGKNVCIYQGVTLGALQVEKNMEEKKRHPTVEDFVIIYANATILGGSTIIGNHSIIGGNTFITKSINPYSTIMQSSQNKLLNQLQIKDTNTFNI